MKKGFKLPNGYVLERDELPRPNRESDSVCDEEL